MTHDRTHAIVACMRDLADKALEAHIMDDSDQIDINLQRSARALGVACDDVVAAMLYPWTGNDEAHAVALWDFLRGERTGPEGREDRAVACRVAARFAEVALALATQATGAEEAAWLWNAAGRLSGLQAADTEEQRAPMTAADHERLQVHTALAESMVRMAPDIVAVASVEGVTVTHADHVRADADRAKASWEATQGAHALAMVGAAVGLSSLPKDPLDAARAITDKLATSQRPVANGPQVGDIIAAAVVPRRTLVECPNKDLVIRMPTGKGWSLDAAGGPAHSGWPWDSGMADTPKVRVLALNIPAEKCFAVAGMTPAEAREWLAHRVAGEAV